LTLQIKNKGGAVRKFGTLLGMVGILALGSAWAEVLELNGVMEERVYEGRTFEHVLIKGSRYITLRNCNVRGATQYYAACIQVEGSSYITIENCDIDGNAKACNGINNHGSGRLLVKNCRIHNVNDDGIEHHYGTLSDYVGNRIYTLHACGTDDGCSPCDNGHSDGIEIWQGTKVNLVGNLLYGKIGNACLFLGQGSPVSTDVVMHNNIMASSSAGYTAYIWYCNRLRAYNNIFWNGYWGDIWWGIEQTDSYFRNNIVGGAWSYRDVSYTPANHHIDNNLFVESFANGANNLTNSNPRFVGTPNTSNLDPNAFKLASNSPCINKGVNDGNTPATDINNLARNGLPDIGPHEYGGMSGIPERHRISPSAAGLADVLTLQVYPSPMTRVAYFSTALLEVAEPVCVNLFDQAGRPVRQLVSAPHSAVVSWDGKGANGDAQAPGMYWYTVTSGGQRFSGRIVKTE
jgi:hypothetical protein